MAKPVFFDYDLDDPPPPFALQRCPDPEIKWTLLTKVETSCDRILIAGGANVEAEWEQGPAV